METDDRYTDAWGRVVHRPHALFEALYRGVIDFADHLIEDAPEIRSYNDQCRAFDHPDLCVPIVAPLALSPEEFHRGNQAQWFIPDEYRDADIVQIVLDRCTTHEERERVAEEFVLYHERDFFPVLRYLHYMVETLRQQGVWWGVGRGSSVASYVLYLLGVHKVDSIRYALDIREFLK